MRKKKNTELADTYMSHLDIPVSFQEYNQVQKFACVR